MSVYLIRWPNQSVSFIEARSTEQAIELADEFGPFNSETCHIVRVKHFALDFEVGKATEADCTYYQLSAPIQTGDNFYDQLQDELEACWNRR